MACECGKCTDCLQERGRRGARDRKARQRAAVKFAQAPRPLLAIMTHYTEDPAWIERKLAAEDAARLASRHASRC